MLIISHKGKKSKTTMRYHVTPVRMAAITYKNILSRVKDVGKKETLYSVGGNVILEKNYIMEVYVMFSIMENNIVVL